jgi:hypothetical protein
MSSFLTLQYAFIINDVYCLPINDEEAFGLPNFKY